MSQVKSGSQVESVFSVLVSKPQLQHIADPNTNTKLTVSPLAIAVLRVRVSFMPEYGLAFASIRVNLRRVKIQIQAATVFYLQQIHISL